jgi:AcrR family transcriptional regulator
MRERGVRTRTQILEAAERGFAEHGYDALGVDEICRAAGVTKGGFYHHFPSKQALFVSLLHGWLERLEAELAAISGRAAGVPDAILAMGASAQQIIMERRDQLPILLDFWAQAVRDPVIWQDAVNPYRRYTGFLQKLIERGIADGAFRPVDARAATRALVSLALGLFMQSMLDPAGDDWARVTREALGLYLRSITL